ncbi:MAG: two-component sensor histidine kinase [Proteobacteria bacterium]|nr:two-component sensor histidine kinase [Pseudomonadota bacterium]
MAQRRPLSIQARSLLAAGIALAAFLGLTGFALDQAVYETLRSSLRDRLQSYVYGYLAASDVARSRRWLPPDVSPDPRFDRPDGGLYAGVVGPVENNGKLATSWHSPSAAAMKLPFDGTLKPGEAVFAGPVPGADANVYMFSLGVTWDVPNRGAVNLTLHVAEDARLLANQRDVFRRSLFEYLGGLGALLLVLLLATLRWSLRPLRRIADDLMRVERGEREHLSTAYPRELAGLAVNLNRFIDGEREHLARYRNTLSDLAHSLKTPLAVIRNELESGAGGESMRWTVLEQSGRMDQIVAYQLARAVASGHSTFATPIALQPHAEEIVAGLEKVYAAKNILCEFEIDARARFYGEPGDLLELLGNLLENAFKWAQHQVLLTACPVTGIGAKRDGLLIVVEDDGPGIAPENVDRMLQRGVRGDERVQGHGIGLAIVQDLLKAYRGKLEVTRSETLGGAKFVVRFEAA